MSSTDKTPNRQLNSWRGTDRVKREDFNYDNEQIDKAFSGTKGAGGHDHSGDGEGAPIPTAGIQNSAVTTAKLANGAATDEKIGDRTINSGISPDGNTGRLGVVLGWLANRIRAITGKSDWKTEPAINLEATKQHVDSTNNPHSVTKAQVGLGNVDNVKQASKTEFDSHVGDNNNPHGTTKAHVGLGSVLNYGVSTQAEAEAGTSNTKYMTPQRTAQAITKQAIEWVQEMGYGSHIKEVADWDTITATGFYASSVNSPDPGTIYYGIHIRRAATFAIQIAGRSGNLFVRSMESGTWTSWNRQETTAGAQAKVNAHEAKKDNPHNVTAEQVTSVNGFNATTAYNSIPKGVTISQIPSSSGYPLANGTLITNNANQHRCSQFLFSHDASGSNQRLLFRVYHQDSGWSPWHDLETTTGSQAKANAAKTAAETAAIDWVKDFGLGATAKDITGTNLNNLNATGFYIGNSLTNAPNNNSGWFSVIHTQIGLNGATQIAIHFTTSIKMFIRRRSGGSWESWVEQETAAGAQAKANAVDSAQVNVIPMNSRTDASTPRDYPLGHSTMQINIPAGATEFPQRYAVLNTWRTNEGVDTIQTLHSTTSSHSYWRRAVTHTTWGSWIQLESTTSSQARVDALDVALKQVGIRNTSMTASTNTNLNNYVTGGLYAVPGNATNRPATEYTSTAFLRVEVLSSTQMVQTWSPINNPDHVWVRSRSGSTTWTDWVMLMTNADPYSNTVVAHGSNNNGNFVRYSDGTQICWGQPMTYGGVNDPIGSIYRTDFQSWTYPAAFDDTYPPSVASSGALANRWASPSGQTTNGSCSIRMYSPVVTTQTSILNVIAVGRWRP